MKKIIAALVAAILALTALLTTAPAASATTPDYYGPWNCQTYRDISTCVSLDWARQADDTGVRLEGLQVRTETGCGSLEDGGKYDPVKAWAVNENTGVTDYAYDFGVEPCAFYKDLSNAVGEAGHALVTVEIKQRVDNAADRWLGWTFRLKAGGGIDVVDRWQVSAS